MVGVFQSRDPVIQLGLWYLVIFVQEVPNNRRLQWALSRQISLTRSFEAGGTDYQMPTLRRDEASQSFVIKAPPTLQLYDCENLLRKLSKLAVKGTPTSSRFRQFYQ